MGTDRRRLMLGALAGSALAGLASARAAAAPAPGCDSLPLLPEPQRQPDAVIPIWPDGPPGSVPAGLVEARLAHPSDKPKLPSHYAVNITRPTLSLFRAAEPNGTALLIAPGGGYSRIMIEQAGWDLARYFNQLGITGYVMTYRLPQQGWSDGADAPLADAEQAMRMIRQRAASDGIDPQRVFALGSSAGGHVIGSLATRYAEAEARPNGVLLCYPVLSMRDDLAHLPSRENLLGPNPSEEAKRAYSVECGVRPEMPPAFLVHAADDTTVSVDNSLALEKAMRTAGVPAELHIYPAGGHAFGLRHVHGTLAEWPQLASKWITAQP